MEVPVTAGRHGKEKLEVANVGRWKCELMMGGTSNLKLAMLTLLPTTALYDSESL